MNKFIVKNLITVICLLGAVLSVNAQVITSAQVKTQIANQLTETYKKQYQDVDVQVKIMATPFAEIQLPDGKVTYKITQGADKIMPRDIKRVDVFVNDAFVRTLNLPAQTSVYKDVLVASDYINREQAITKETTEVKRIDISMKMDYVLTARVLEKERSATKAFPTGELIDKRFVKMRPDGARNGDVRIYFVANGAVMITIDGTAMADGMYGDYVNVENKNYKKVYTGKVIGENRVLVNI